MRQKLFIAILTLLIVSCGNKNSRNSPLELAEISKQELADAIQERDSLILLMGDISRSMDQIRHLENIMMMTNARNGENPTQRSQILKDLNVLQSVIRQRRNQLENLEMKLKSSVFYGQQLESVVSEIKSQLIFQTTEIETLRNQLASAKETIGALDRQVDSLSSTISFVSSQRDSMQNTSQALEDALNTCFYVVATKSELRKHGIIETGFLRKTKLMKGDFDKGFFVISNKRTLRSLPLGSNKARILTNHPDGSYEITDTEEGRSVYIKDPIRFWETGNYLVVQIN